MTKSRRPAWKKQASDLAVADPKRAVADIFEEVCAAHPDVKLTLKQFRDSVISARRNAGVFFIEREDSGDECLKDKKLDDLVRKAQRGKLRKVQGRQWDPRDSAEWKRLQDKQASGTELSEDDAEYVTKVLLTLPPQQVHQMCRHVYTQNPKGYNNSGMQHFFSIEMLQRIEAQTHAQQQAYYAQMKRENDAQLAAQQEGAAQGASVPEGAAAPVSAAAPAGRDKAPMPVVEEGEIAV